MLAGVPSVAMAYLNEEMDSSVVVSAMGLYISGNAMGGMAGRIVSAVMSDYMPWRSAIGVIGCISLVLHETITRVGEMKTGWMWPCCCCVAAVSQRAIISS